MNPKLAAIIQKNILLRKSYGLLQQIPRTGRRLAASAADYQAHPPILVNSFPKSGTHLLLQMMQAAPGMTHYGAFLASMPPKPHRERSRATHLRMIGRLAPGELMPAHLFYHPEYAAALDHKQAIHFFIYRDPRDVVISEAHYLTDMHRWHDLHPYFARLASLEARISFSIQGASGPDFPFDFPDVGQRFERYRPWLTHPGVFPLRFEEIMSEKREELLRRMAVYLLERGIAANDPIHLASQLGRSILPDRSRTFRKGTAGQWQQIFTPDHKAQIKGVAGQLLVDLGYEQGLDW